MDSIHKIELADGGILLYQEQFLEPSVADVYFEVLKDRCQWEQKQVFLGICSHV